MTQVYVHDMTTILVRLDPFWLDGGPQSCLPIRITLGSLPGQDSQDETGVGLEGPGHRHFVNCSRAFTDKKNLRIPTAPTPFTTIRIFHVFKGKLWQYPEKAMTTQSSTLVNNLGRFPIFHKLKAGFLSIVHVPLY